MADTREARRGKITVNQVLGGLTCGLAALSVYAGYRWYESLIVLCIGIIFVSGPPRRIIFRAGVTRADDEIVLRYVPPYEWFTYMGVIVLPAVSLCGIAVGSDPKYPSWLRIAGIVLLPACAVVAIILVFTWRRSILRITPATLTVRPGLYGAAAHTLLKIPREHVHSIHPNWIPGTIGFQVVIEYSASPGDEVAKTVALGPRGPMVSVHPENLLQALNLWKDSVEDDPTDLMDRAERILRDRASTPL